MSKTLVTPWRRLLVLGVAVVAGCAQAFVLAQAPPGQSPAFEAVSIATIGFPESSMSLLVICLNPLAIGSHSSRSA